MKQFIPLLILISLIFAGCGPQNSPLSDVKLTDPSLIRPSIRLVQEINEDDRATSSIEVWLYDKNNNTIEIQNGEVRMNGKVMKVRKLSGTGAPYYTAIGTDAMIRGNADYRFEIRLSDGKVYTASVKTPDEMLDDLEIPEDFNANDDLEISWGGVYPYDNMQAKLDIYYETDESTGIKGRDLHIPSRSVARGIYTISRNNFQVDHGTAYKVLITLSGWSSGTIDKHFAAGSEITASYSISKELRARE